MLPSMDNKTVVEKSVDTEITDILGALKIIGVARMTLDRWENQGYIKSFKRVYNRRIRKCFLISDLKKLVGNFEEK